MKIVKTLKKLKTYIPSKLTRKSEPLILEEERIHAIRKYCQAYLVLSNHKKIYNVKTVKAL